MLIPLLLGSITALGCLAIQIIATIAMLRFVRKRYLKQGADSSFWQTGAAISMVMLGLFIGHMLQIAIWAELFILVGEFTDFSTAFYFSAVSFATLGYGDIVMSPQWRLLGGLEASNGVFMFGLSTGAMLAVISRMFADQQNHQAVQHHHD